MIAIIFIVFGIVSGGLLFWGYFRKTMLPALKKTLTTIKLSPVKRGIVTALVAWFLLGSVWVVHNVLVWRAKTAPYDRLINAIGCGDVKRVEMELDKGTNPNDMPGGNYDEPFRPICAAASSGNIEIVKLLVARGARVDYGDGWDYTPLEAAATHEHIDVMAFLVKQGAKVNDDGEGGSFSLSRSATLNKVQPVEWLLAHGANPNTLGTQTERLLDVVVRMGYSEVADALRKAGAK